MQSILKTSLIVALIVATGNQANAGKIIGIHRVEGGVGFCEPLGNGNPPFPGNDDFVSPSSTPRGPNPLKIPSVSEPSSTLSLLTIGILGTLVAASTKGRKLKPSQPSEKETIKVG